MNADYVLIAAKNMYDKAEREASNGVPAAALSYRVAAKKFRQAAEMVSDKKEKYIALAEKCDEKAKEIFVTLKSDAKTNNGEKSTEINNDAVVVEKSSFDEVLTELDALPVKESVKKVIREIALKLQVSIKRHQMGLPISDGLCHHYIFVGDEHVNMHNTAKIVAKAYAALGIFQNEKITEVSRADLVALYIGGSTVKTRAVIEKALGGVLFIDDAFNLHREGDSYEGDEVIYTLIEAMNDYRDDLVIIISGYAEPMKALLEKHVVFKAHFHETVEFGG